MVKRSNAKGRGGKVKPRTRPYPYEFRVKMVRLFLEEGYSTSILRESFGVSSHSVHRWARAYREQVPEGLPFALVKSNSGKSSRHSRGFTIQNWRGPTTYLDSAFGPTSSG